MSSRRTTDAPVKHRILLSPRQIPLDCRACRSEHLDFWPRRLHTICSCGEMSGHVSRTERQQWKRAHKAAIRGEQL